MKRKAKDSEYTQLDLVELSEDQVFELRYDLKMREIHDPKHKNDIAKFE